MKVCLIDVDSKIPNVALMKLSTYHKAKGDTVKLTDDQLCEIIRDNPAGQDDQCTPFMLIRKK